MLPDPSHFPATTVIRNIGQLLTVAQRPILGASGPLQIIENASLAVHHGTITWLGSDDDAERLFQPKRMHEGLTFINAQHALVTPGFVDSHTHLIFAGDRAGTRYPYDYAGHTLGQFRYLAGTRARTSRQYTPPRHHDRRDQDGLWPE